MPIELLGPLQRDALIDFLTSAFHLPKTAPFVAPRLLDWKYDEPRPDWQGSRSYAWMERGEIVAHACLCPATYRMGTALVTGSYLIDWAADRRFSGAGVLLLRKLASLFQMLLAIGGSADTQQILPKLGYRDAGELAYFARVVRPWRQYQTDPFPRGWKGPLRLARNTVWSWAASPPVGPEWSCIPLAAFGMDQAALLEAETPFPATCRNPELMNFLLRCPTCAMSAYLIRRRENPCGWFVLSRVEGVARITDLRIASTEPAWWRAAYGLATQTALADPEVCELVTAASVPLRIDAIRGNGFRPRHTERVFLLDRQNLLMPHAPLDVALLDSDLAYLYDPQYPYLT